jgi:DNA repair exonuclease SbcCD nuclease subunit
MIYVTGDTHGGIDMEKLDNDHFKEQAKLTKDDYVIVAGDFGFIWQGNEKQRKLLELLGELNYTLLFIDGNHENFRLLNAYPLDTWNGGKIHRITDSVIHLIRGQFFTIAGETLFTFGGGDSMDKQWRTPNISWWPEELPSEAQYQEGLANLEAHNWEADYVITHEGPAKIVQSLNRHFGHNPLCKYLQNVAEKLRFKKWYFGHYHCDEIIENKYYALYRNKILFN